MAAKRHLVERHIPMFDLGEMELNAGIFAQPKSTEKTEKPAVKVEEKAKPDEKISAISDPTQAVFMPPLERKSNFDSVQMIEDLDKQERYLFILNTYKIFKSVVARAENFKKNYGKTFLEFINKTELFLSADMHPVRETELIYDMIEAVIALRRHVYSLYKPLSMNNNAGGLLRESQADKLQHYLYEEPEGIRMKAVENAILFSAPLLVTRWVPIEGAEKKRKLQQKQKNIGYDSYWSAELRRAMTCSEDFYRIDLDKFLNKTVSFAFVYPSTQSEAFLPDNDKYDIKAALDAVTRFLPAGDMATHCNIVLSTVLTDRLPEGTYITITPMDLPVLTMEEIISIWNSP